MNNGFKVLFLLVASLTMFSFANAQVSLNDIQPILNASDQKSLEKIEGTLNKAISIDEEAQKIKLSGKTDNDNVKNEKKYTLKRLEASQYYQKANSDYISLFKDNISRFWKKNKTLQVDAVVKNNEDKANELARKARSLRYVAEDLTYPDEKLSKILEAEILEKDAITIFIKVLYAYINRPIGYDVKKGNTVVIETDTSKVEVENTNESKTIAILPIEIKDSIATVKQVTTDTTAFISESKPIDNVTTDSQVKEKTEKMVPEVIAAKDTGSLYEMVSVNENQVDKFNKFLEKSYPDTYENYVINFRELNYKDVDSLKATWYRYLNKPYTNIDSEPVKKPTQLNDTPSLIANNEKDSTITKSATQKTSNTNKDLATPNSLVKTEVASISNVGDSEANNDSTKTSYEVLTEKLNSSSNIFNSSDSTVVKNNASTDSSKTKPMVVSAKPAVVNKPLEISENPANNTSNADTTLVSSINLPKNNITESVNNEVAKGFVYRIQVSACRIPLDAKTLKGIYGGNLEILELKEDNWFKYAVGEFNTYSEAKHLKEQINVPGAFVIAYLNGKRISIFNTSASQVLGIASQNNSTITYKVQIVASKKPLENTYIHNIYNGPEKIEQIFEDGWYKYAISIGPSLKAAKIFIEKEEIPGAFITSYLGDTKIELKEALKLNKAK